MKRFVFLFISIIVITLLINPPSVFASCQLGSGKKISIQVAFQGNKTSGSSMTVSGKTYTRNPPQCTNPVASNTYTISCDEVTEINATDSLFAPLCGASGELNKTNATCWVCGGDLKCNGLDFGTQGTTSYITDQANRMAIPPSTSIDQVWRVKNPPQSFTFNGQTYDMKKAGTSGVVVCTSNLPACGVDDSSGVSCHNYIFPDVKTGPQDSSEDNTPTEVSYTPGATGLPPSQPGIMRQCDDLSEKKITIAEAASCGSTDILTFIAPNCGGGMCPTTQSSAFPLGVSWPGVVTNQVVWIDSTHFKQVSNDKYLLYEVSGGMIKMIEDHTWENSETCEGDGPAYQKTFNGNFPNGSPGLDWSPVSASCGQSWNIHGYNLAFSMEANLECKAISGHAGSFDNVNRLIYNGTATCNGDVPVDMIAIQVVSGAGAGEVFIYCNSPSKKGLCAWYEGIDFTVESNKPANWKLDTDVCNLANTVPECPSSPPICPLPVRHIARDITDERIITGQSKPTWEESEDEEGNTIITLFDQLPFSWDGSYYPDVNYIIPELDSYGRWLKAADKKVNPRAIQQITQDNICPQYTSTATRRCVYDNEGNLIKNEVSQDVIKTHPIAGIPLLDQYSQSLASKYGMLKRADQNYMEATESIQIDSAYDCAVQTTGMLPRPVIADTIGEIKFDIFEWLENKFQAAIGVFARETMIRNPSKRTKSEVMAGNLAHLTGEDLSYSPISDDQKQTYIDTPGVVESSRIGMISYRTEDINGENVSGFIESNGSKFELPTRTYLTKLVQDAGDYYCATVSKASWMPGRCKKPLTIISPPVSTVPTPTVSPLNCDPDKPVTVSSPSVQVVPKLTYNLPYKNTGCVVTDEMICQAVSKMKSYYSGTDWEMGVANFDKFAKFVQSQAAASGMNPTLALAIWIEESAAINGLSCGAGAVNGSGSDQGFLSSQVQCVSSLVKNLNPFLHFMCQYAGEDQTNGYQCKTPATNTFINNPSFPSGLEFWYKFLSQKESSSCQTTPITNAASL